MFFEILYFILIVSSITLVIMENRKPGIAIFWVMVLTLLPVVGLVLYLIFGKNFRSRRVIRSGEMEQISKLLDEAGNTAVRTNPDNPKYNKLASMMRGANDAPLFAGNDVQIFTDFSPMFNSMLTDIKGATEYVHIQFYKIEDDEVGHQLADLLIEKAQQGVDVRLMYDSFANLFVRSRYYNKMRDGGVKVQPFLKIIPSMLTRDVNCRTHRKIVVVDGRVGYTGGMNIARRYRDGINNGIWRDTHIRIAGPAVGSLELALVADWRFCTKELLASPYYFPTVTTMPGDALCQIVTSGPMDEWDTVMQGMVQAIAQSQRYIYLQTPYFIPTEPILLAICNAAIAGVDVRIMIPSTADRGSVMLYATESYFAHAMKAGVKFYLYDKGYLHAKTMVADDEFLTIGSTNIDSRSFGQNFEVNAFIYDDSLAIQQRNIFLRDMEDCRLVDELVWMQRPFKQKATESLARLLTPLL